MVEAVTRSGYLLEQRVLPIIEEYGYYSEANAVYPDPVTGKSREYDFSALSAIKVYREDWDFLWIHLIGECLNNSQPLVFFSSKMVTDFCFHEDLKCSGIPLKFPWREEKGSEMSFQDFFHLDKFHHYCQGPFSTQYCSFRQKRAAKTEWMAFHDDDHHNLFNSLVAATGYEISEDFSSWNLPKKDKQEPLDLHLFYPLLILKGKLYECKQSRGKPVFTSRKHIQFRKSIVSSEEQKTFQIDVITESNLKQYLSILEEEHEKLKIRLRRKKKDVRDSIERIISQARNAKSKRKLKDFREILEF